MNIETIKAITSTSRLVFIETYEGKPVSDRTFTCCLCGHAWQGFGNNPAPLGDVETDRCCGPCNATKVIPTRVARNWD